MSELLQKLSARAWFIGSRIELRELSKGSTVALGPLTMLIGHHGYSMIFRFGVVVMFGLSEAEEKEIIDGLKDSVHNRYDRPE